MQTRISITLGLFLVLSFSEAANYLTQKPDFLTPCVVDDANFNKCLSSNMHNFLLQYKDGIPGVNSVGSFDPLHVKRVRFTHDGGNAITINAELKDVLVKGVSQLSIKEARYNRDQHLFKILVSIPKLRFDFNYKLKGQVLALNLNGNGKGYFESEKLTGIIEVFYQPRITPEASFVDLQKLKITFKDIGNFRIKLDNLFAGNAELENIAHRIFNDNWREFFEILRPAAERSFEGVLQERMKKTFDYIPATLYILFACISWQTASDLLFAQWAHMKI